MRQQQRGKAERGRGEQVRAVQQDDRGGREQAEQKDGRDAESVERFALFGGEEDYEDGDGNEEDYEVDHEEREDDWMVRFVKD